MNPLATLGRRRAEALIAAAVLAVALTSALLASRALGPTFEELGRLAGVERAEQLVLKVASAGWGSVSVADLRALSSEADAPSALALSFAAWSKLSLGRLGLLDPLTCARLPWLIASALAPLFLFAIVRPSRGPFAAALAALFLLFLPRWLHATGVGSTQAALSGVWLLAIALHLRASAPQGSRRRLCWAAGAAIALGWGAALSLATLWLVSILLVHHWVVNRGSVRRLLRRGRVPIPLTLVLAVPLGPVVFFLCRPELWSPNPTTTARGLFAALAPRVDPTMFLGSSMVGASPPVLAYGATWLLWTLPTIVLLAALLGLASIVHRALARSFASGRLRPARDRRALGTLVVLGGSFTLVGPALAPSPLLVFPPRLELVLPFVAIAAALGVEVAARRAVGARVSRAWVPAALIIAAMAWQTLRDPATTAASYAPLLGGANGAMRRGLFAIGDGSELGALAPHIDRVGVSPVALHSPQVPEVWWQELRRYGRMKATVVRAPNAALRVERGPVRTGRALGVVERDGASLWTLAE